MTRLTLLLLIVFPALPFQLQAQSISGLVRTETSALGYATVDIYQNDKLVASTLTDASGNYRVSLKDTGIYRCEIQYLGHAKEVEYIRVTGDLEKEHTLKEDGSKFLESVVTSASEDRITTPRYRSDRLYTRSDSKSKLREIHAVDDVDKAPLKRAIAETAGGLTLSEPASNNAQAGMLTAGELNDFNKWDFWKDLGKTDLHVYRNLWQMTAQHRYVFQVVNEFGFPIVDAKVRLLNEAGDVIWLTKTDNTGKAECWANLSEPETAPANLQAEVVFNGVVTSIKRVKPFEQRMNELVLSVGCGTNNTVDIAFVVDATGSMSDEIQFLKAELNQIIYQSKLDHPELDLHFSNVFYRDVTDEYTTRHQPFTRILSHVTAFISDQKASGGGDYPEAVEVALDTAINGLDWHNEARSRILFLVLDAPPHSDSATVQKMRVLYQQAAAKGIRIVPIVASGINKSSEFLFRNAALTTNGTYVYLTDESGIGGTHISPTTDSLTSESLQEILVRLVKNYTFLPPCTPNSSANNDTTSWTITPVPLPKPEGDSPLGDSLVWTVYPNPCFGELSIRADKDIQTIEILDFNGKIVRRFNLNTNQRKFETNLVGLSQGIYYIRLFVNEKVFVRKIIYQR